MSIDIHCGDMSLNITYNLGPMFNEAFGAKGSDWYDLLEGKKGEDIIPLIDKAIDNMVLNPYHYKKFDASNGWGTYEQALPWLIQLRQEIYDNKECIITSSR